MNSIKKTLAGLCAVCIGTVAVPFAGGTMESIMTVSAAEDISSSMEWGTLRIGGGGFVSGIVTGKKVMFARTDVGGAYRYNYDTESWEQLLGFVNEADRGLLSVDAMAVDPTDDNTAYFLCGCAYFSDAKTVIYKTTDGGNTFKEIDVTDLIQVFGNGHGRQCGEAIAVDPDNPNIIYAGGDVAASAAGLIKSTDGGETWQPVDGYAELVFGGRHYFEYNVKWPFWTEHVTKAATTDIDGESGYVQQNGVSNIEIVNGKVYVGTSVVGMPNIVAANVKDDEFSVLSESLPTDVYPSRINADANGNLIITYMAGLNFQGTSGGAYKYEVKDGKVTDIAPTKNGFGEIYPDPENPDRLIATTCGVWSGQMYSADAWDREAVAWGDQFFRSTDGGKTWEGITPGKEKSWNGPREADFIQTGGYDWIKDKAIHWVGSMVLDPRDPNRAFLTSGNGSFVCTDIWGELPVYTFHPDGIEEVVSLDFVSVPGGANYSAIGDYDGFIHTDVSEVPEQYKPNMGSTSAIAYCPADTKFMARVSENNSNGYYSTDAGQTWKEMKFASSSGKLSVTKLGEGKYRIFQSSTSGQLSYTDDFGGTWNKCDGIDCSKTVYTLVDPEDPAKIYASGVKYNDYWASDTTKTEPTLEECHYSLYVSEDYGKTFKGQTLCRYDMCDSTGDPAYVTKDTVAVAGGWYGLYLTKDGGKTAEKLESVFYAKTVGYGAPESAGGPNTLYIYGKPAESDPEGIYRSTDAGQTWVCINTDHLYGGTGNGNYLVGDINEFGTVYMSTVGCGIVYGKLSNGSSKPPVTTKTTTSATTTTTTTTSKTTTVSSTTSQRSNSGSSSTATSTTKPVSTDDKDIMYGDANCDGKTDLSDAVLIMQYLSNPSKYGEKGSDKGHMTEQGKKNADVTGKGDGVTNLDALAIQRYQLKLIDKLPTE